MFAIAPKNLVDIEDMIDVKSNQLSKRPTVHVSRRKFDNKTIEDNDDELALSAPSKKNDHAVTPDRVLLSKDTFQEWLARKKHLWNFKDRRKRKRAMLKPPLSGALISDSPSKKPKKASGSMAGYIREASQSLASKEWHILEIRDVNSSDGGLSSSFSGELVMWVMLSNGNLQRLNITMNRTFFVSCAAEVPEKSTNELTVRRVEKHLPHNKSSKFLYEVSVPELTYRNQSWLLHFRSDTNEDLIESLYEMSTSELFRSLIQVGCICRMSPNAQERSGKYSLKDLKFIDSPKEGSYLNTSLQFRKLFLFERLHSRSQTGIVTLFIVNESDADNEVIDLTTQCYLWIVRPSGERGQKNVSKKICESMFSELLQHLKEQAKEVQSSGYSAISSESLCKVVSLDFVKSESNAFKGTQEVLNSYAQANRGPTLLLVNSMKSVAKLRKGIPSCNSFPLISMPLPPGTYHRSSSLQSINWEKEVLQRSLESFFYMGAESLSKQIEYARYAKVPLGNLGCDPILMSYDTMYSRILQKNRSLLWTNEKAGFPDTGISAISLISGSSNLTAVDDGVCMDSNVIWGDDEDNLCPVIRFPGAYRCIVAEIDIHNLAIAALSDSRSALAFSSLSGSLLSDNNTTLGDEMSTAVSLPLLRILIQIWLRDAAANGNTVADQLLCHLYRLISTPEARLSDPALHRTVVSLMKGTFSQLLGEFQRLGSTIISASFHRITIATNKYDLSEAIEYVNFVLATIQNRLKNEESTDFARMTLQPNQYYTHFLFLDDHNFGGIRLENREPDDDDEAQWAFEVAVPSKEGDVSRMIVTPTSISGWNIMHYLASEISQEYFRLIVSRFSKDIYRKQLTLSNKQNNTENEQTRLPREQLLEYKKKLIAKHLSADMTTAVSEILSDGGGPESFPQLPGSHLKLKSPALEFIKNVIVVLELDPDVDKEVQNLKKSLLAQIGIQEYSSQAKWENPCASFILPDVFCSECQESRDVDLCVIPPPDENQVDTWTCDDCGTPFDSDCIERRLIDIVEQKCVRYQLQDLRCAKTSRVARRALAKQSEISQKLQLDMPQEGTKNEIQILSNLAKFYNLEWLSETTDELLQRF
jgi:DNA polymerase epsilon subunit 1